MQKLDDRKLMTFSEGSLSALFAVLALFCFFAAAEAQDATFAFEPLF